MKRSNIFLIITGLVSLVANILAIAGYFLNEGPFAKWQPDRGLLAVLTFVLLAYGLAMWSALVRRWTRHRGATPSPDEGRQAMFLLNGLATFPLLTLWLHLLFSIVLFTEVSSTERWFLAMGIAWGATPFIAWGLMATGDVLGPLLARDRNSGNR